MKCLSLWQPWASLLAHGEKKVETRGWRLRHYGPLLIHAATRWNRDLKGLCETEPFRTALKRIGDDLPFGAIVGRVNVIGCFPTEEVGTEADLAAVLGDVIVELPWQGASDNLYVSATERTFGDYSPGRFAILCDRFTPFDKPIKLVGRQGLFDVPDSVLAKAGV